MGIFSIISIVLVIAIVAFVLARGRSIALVSGATEKLHSRPGYYGTYALIWASIPALALMALWSVASPVYVENQVRAGFPQEILDGPESGRNLAMGMVRNIGEGIRLLDETERTQLTAGFVTLRPLLATKGIALASNGEDYMISAAQALNGLTDTSRWLMTVAVIGLAVAGAVWSILRIRIRLRARNQVEGIILAGLVLSSTIAILTTVGIIASMLSETLRFFSYVPPLDFFFGTVWDPRFANANDPTQAGQFGLIPLLAGTLYIAFVAMVVAVPIGLFSAIYMAEYAEPKLRSVAKPLLEVLAGIPTIVYGFFALITMGPLLRDLSANISGLMMGDFSPFISATSVLCAGLVMGIMLIPFVSSLSDDIINAVPQSMRDGSLGLGATHSETVKRVILPAALPGIVAALLLTASRAIGETMIVVLAAGIAARLTVNPFEAMTTVTVKIVSQLTGDLEFTSPQTLVAFALGITLFFITLCLNAYALHIVRKYREQYD
jgi:phosphate transport system permease protein